MFKRFKYKIFPTSSQEKKIKQSLDACRWVYNKTLEVRKNSWEEKKEGLSLYDTIKMLPGWKDENPSLRNVHSQILQEACMRVDLAFEGFFWRIKNGEKPGYPRFKGKGYGSFTFTQFGFKITNSGHLRLSKIGDVKIKLHRPLEGKVKTLNIKRDNLGCWFACFTCQVAPEPLPPTEKVVGIDLGLTTFAHLSNGNKIERERWKAKDTLDIVRLQRKVARLEKGSPERKKAIRAVQHAFKRSANRRNNFNHQESRKLINEYQFIAFEDLDIREMESNKNKVVNRGIADVSWKRFVQFTAYKAESAGRGFALVDPKDTTKQCSKCGEIVPKDLRTRIHECPHCGLVLNRDHNAALNILARGLASISIQSVKALDELSRE